MALQWLKPGNPKRSYSNGFHRSTIQIADIYVACEYFEEATDLLQENLAILDGNQHY